MEAGSKPHCVKWANSPVPQTLSLRLSWVLSQTAHPTHCAQVEPLNFQTEGLQRSGKELPEPRVTHERLIRNWHPPELLGVLWV